MLNKRTVRRRVESQLIPHSFVCALGFPYLPPLQWKCQQSSCDLRLLTCRISAGNFRLTRYRREKGRERLPACFWSVAFHAVADSIWGGKVTRHSVVNASGVAEVELFATYFLQYFVYYYWDKKNVNPALSKLDNKTGTWDLFTWNGKENTLVCF